MYSIIYHSILIYNARQAKAMVTTDRTVTLPSVFVGIGGDCVVGGS